MRCQRCLGTFRFSLELVSTLLLIPPGGEWPEEELDDDGVDAVAADKAMSLLSLIEDEVLLALPLAPRHDVCSLPAAAEKTGRPSPFEVLSRLKKN